MAKDVPTYKHLGQIYPGDYLENIPYEEYLKEQPVQEGLQIFDIRDFGAVPDGETLNTEALRDCAAACGKAGGGVILVSGGDFVTGSFTLPSHCTLHIQRGSSLVASRDVHALLGDREVREDPESSGGAFIEIADAEDVTITGGGTICGRGEWFVHEPRMLPAFWEDHLQDVVLLPRMDQVKELNTLPGSIRTAYRDRIRYAEDKYEEDLPVLRRPSYMVWFHGCRNVRVENICLRDAMCWTLHMECCDDVVIRDLVIDDNRHVANTDGIDLSGCRKALVEHCFISCADDGICLKNPASTGRATEDIQIHDCRVCTVMSAFKIGTATVHPIRNVRVERCSFFMPDLYPGSVCGISIESCDGSEVTDIHLKDISMDHVQCPLYIILDRRNEAGDPYTDLPGENAWWGGSVSGITLEDIRAEHTDLPCIITGFMDRNRQGRTLRRLLRNISIRGFHVHQDERPAIVQVMDETPEFLTGYPECNAHGDVPASGMYLRHAEGIQLSDIRIVTRPDDEREVIIYEDVTE
ncbi:MAG: hypothetical protein IJ083_11370 [Clostridia bacterium]|nr:hypothetical protein [Clostridia bacterium]